MTRWCKYEVPVKNIDSYTVYNFFLIISCAARAEHVINYLIVYLTYGNTLSLVIR